MEEELAEEKSNGEAIEERKRCGLMGSEWK
jgi:hypothetical protein